MNRVEKNTSADERGAISGFLIGMIFAILVALGLGAGFYWSYTQMNHYKTDAESMAQSAAKDAADKQKKSDKESFDKEYNDFPNAFTTFTAPVQFGNVSFQYPRTWSQYIDSNTNTMSVYFNPVSIPPLSDKTPYALRVVIEKSSYTNVLNKYKGLVNAKPPKLTASTIDTGVDGAANGTRFDGQFNQSINGSVAIFSLLGGNYTLELYTDNPQFVPYFDQTILPTLKYQK